MIRFGDSVSMPKGPPFDPRAVANLMLDQAAVAGLKLSNLALQKLLYFAHGQYLIRTGNPLLDGCFEAWTYGPVHPAVYRAFKCEEGRPIETRATARDVMTGATRPMPVPDDIEVQRVIVGVLGSLGHLSAGRLIEITHAPDGPWAFVVNKAKTSVVLGLRISDNVTRERFRFQRVSVGPDSRVGEPNEDSPLV